MTLLLEHISVAVGTFELALDVQLHGNVVGIFGPSGAGKTTLLELVAGLRRPRRGRVVQDGIEFLNTAKRFAVPPPMRHVGYVPQDGALFPHLNVERNLRFGHHNPTPPVTFDHVVEVLELAPFLRRPIDGLSGGEQQRVALGRALLSGARLLLLDEPLAGLDSPLKARVMPYLIRVRDEFKIPMLYVSHSADEIVALCDEVLRIEAGRVIQQGVPLTIFRRSERPAYEAPPDEAG